MKTSQNPAASISLSLVALLLLTPLAGAQTSAISIDRVNYFSQTAASTVTPQAEPFTLNFHIRGGTTDMSNWGPAFYKPGSGGTPQSGASTATNTGTLNFSATPNNGGSFMFMHDFATNAALEAFYPIAPTDGGVYGVKFLGSAPPTPALFDAGLVFAAGTTYPSVTPQIASVNNGAVWSRSTLRINPTGITTLTFNTFPEYSSTTYGSFIAVGIYSNTNGVVDEASTESYYLPLGDSSVPPVVPVNQPAVTQLSIDGSWLTPGVTYTMELQYAIFSGQPEEANLNGIEFQGLATYRKLTTISITVGQPTVHSDFNGDGQSEIVWQNSISGDRYMWFLNGTTMTSANYLTTLPPADWNIAANGDFNGDGKADLVWHSPNSGDSYVWYMDGVSRISAHYLTNRATDWNIAAAGDFNGDGKADLVWQNSSTGERQIWLMDGLTMTSTVHLTTLETGWNIAGSGDFNGDGKSDLVWQHSTSGDRYVWLMNGTSLIQAVYLTTIETDWTIAGSGEFNGDGKSDLLWQHSSGDRYVWMMDGGTLIEAAYIGNVPADWGIVNH